MGISLLLFPKTTHDIRTYREDIYLTKDVISQNAKSEIN